jgi:GTP-binding protein
MKTPCVAIIGRPNVGKSSLFNAICGRRVAIVEATPGVTRDRISQLVRRDGFAFELVDTGGMGLADTEELAGDIQRQIMFAIEQADLVVFVVDAKDGPQPGDDEISRLLRQGGKSVLLVANKCDGPREEQAAAEFYRLGFPHVHLTSAAHRRGIEDLVRRIAEALPEAPPAEGESPEGQAEPMKIAFVGRRNVGKSTLVNFLAQEPRMLVSEVPGTTRDAVDVQFRMGGLEFVAIDTAGLRRRKQVKDSIDFYSTVRSEAAIRRADVVALMLEAPMEVGRLDKQLGDQISSQYKPCVVAVNKVDMAPAPASEEDFHAYVRDRLRGLAYAPIVCMSAQTGQNVVRLIEVARTLHEQSFVRVPTPELNRIMEEVTARRPPPSTSSRHGRIYYAVQVGVKPPTIVLFANEPSLIDENYERYLANALRASCGFSAIPIRFVARSRGGAEHADRDENHAR